MFTTPQTPIQGVHVGKSVAYLMRKTEEGYDCLGDPDRAWVEEMATFTEGDGKVVTLSAPDGSEVTHSWTTVREAAIQEIRGQPFF